MLGTTDRQDASGSVSSGESVESAPEKASMKRSTLGASIGRPRTMSIVVAQPTLSPRGGGPFCCGSGGGGRCWAAARGLSFYSESPTYPPEISSGGRGLAAVRRWLPAMTLVNGLWVPILASVAVFVFDVVVSARSECGWRGVGSPEAIREGLCMEEYAAVSTASQLLLPCVQFVVIGLPLYWKFFMIVAHQHHKLPAFARSAVPWLRKPMRAVGRSWVAAASPDLFDDLCRQLRRMNLLNAALVMPIAICMMLATITSEVTAYSSRLSYPFVAVSCAGSSYESFCSGQVVFSRSLQFLGHSIAMMSSLFIFVTPASAWGHAAQTAAKVNQNQRYRKFLWLPVLSPVVFLLSLVVTAGNRTIVEAGRASPAIVTAFFALEVFYVLYSLFLLWLVHFPQDVWAALNAGSKVTQSTNDSGNMTRKPPECRSFITRIEGSSRTVLLQIFQFVMWSERIAAGRPLWYIVIMLSCRVLGALALLIRESETKLKDLSINPAFGLVVNASDLRRALEAKLAGRPYSGRLRSFKATLFHMRQTLAVSYRWQAEEVEIVPGMRVNLSPMQMRSLTLAIDSAHPRYVWLDRLSVPQDRLEVKFTLLSRMLAVYAGAMATVAIDSIEQDGARYYQRVWTCQEYVMACRLLIMEEGGREECDVLHQQQLFHELREKYKQPLEPVVPLWLQPPPLALLPDHAKTIVEQYNRLSAVLGCSVEADKVRALVPLLAQIPVETHSELVSLVKSISRASGDDLVAWKRALFEQHLGGWTRSSRVRGLDGQQNSSTGTILSRYGSTLAGDSAPGINALGLQSNLIPKAVANQTRSSKRPSLPGASMAGAHPASATPSQHMLGRIIPEGHTLQSIHVMQFPDVGPAPGTSSVPSSIRTMQLPMLGFAQTGSLGGIDFSKLRLLKTSSLAPKFDGSATQLPRQPSPAKLSSSPLRLSSLDPRLSEQSQMETVSSMLPGNVALNDFELPNSVSGDGDEMC